MHAPSVYRIRVPNPFVEGRTCVYVIAADPVTMIDSGIATDRAYESLESGLQEHGLAVGDIQRVVLTHKHIDHIGSAWRFQQASEAEVMIHNFEADSVANVDPSGERYAAILRPRLAEWSVPDDAASLGLEGLGTDWKIESSRVMPLVDGQRIPVGDEHLEVIHTPGHTLGSICLRFGGLLFSGDHLLPDISPNIGGGDLKNHGLLQHYLSSLARIRDLAPEGELRIMPGHGDPMDTFVARCDKLTRHHHRRLEQIVKILERHDTLSVYELARKLFGPMQGFHIILGCAEAHAHLELLQEQERVIETGGTFKLN